MKFTYASGATPIRDDEEQGLIPTHIETQSELNQWEEINIAQAEQWILSKDRFELSERFVRILHSKMFDNTWTWAGKYRTSNKNLGVDYPYIAVEVINLLDDIKHHVVSDTYEFDEIAARLHHRLVFVHPFPNGNGRHTRLYTDFFLLHNGRERFTWGSKNLIDHSDTRRRYITALQKADQHDMTDLMQFVRA